MNILPCMYVNTPVSCNAHTLQEGVGSLELELQVLLATIHLLGTKSHSSARAEPSPQPLLAHFYFLLDYFCFSHLPDWYVQKFLEEIKEYLKILNDQGKQGKPKEVSHTIKNEAHPSIRGLPGEREITHITTIFLSLQLCVCLTQIQMYSSHNFSIITTTRKEIWLSLCPLPP